MKWKVPQGASLSPRSGAWLSAPAFPWEGGRG